jgi:hypothetical protein
VCFDFLYKFYLNISHPRRTERDMMKFPENPSCGSQVVPDKATDVTKLIVAFRNLANAPNNAVVLPALTFSYSACAL